MMNESQFYEAQKKLLQDRGSEAQKEFLHMARDEQSAFCHHISQWGLPDVKISIPETAWNEQQFKNSPWSKDTSTIVDAWHKEIVPQDACKAQYWFAVHVKLMKADIIESGYFGFKEKRENKSGYNAIKRSLDSNDAKEIDDSVRDVLRHLGGIPHVRGKRTAYADCPTAKLWWRYHYTAEYLRWFDKARAEDIYKFLQNSGMWNQLVEAMVSRMTVVGDRHVRPALIAYLMQKNCTKVDETKEIINEIGRRSVVQKFGILSPPEILSIWTKELS